MSVCLFFNQEAPVVGFRDGEQVEVAVELDQACSERLMLDIPSRCEGRQGDERANMSLESGHTRMGRK